MRRFPAKILAGCVALQLLLQPVTHILHVACHHSEGLSHDETSEEPQHSGCHHHHGTPEPAGDHNHPPVPHNEHDCQVCQVLQTPQIELSQPDSLSCAEVVELAGIPLPTAVSTAPCFRLDCRGPPA